MNKFKILYWFIVFCLACNHSSTLNNKNIETPNKDSLLSEVKPETKGYFTIYERDLSMYNEKYLLKITPIIDSVNYKYETYILLTKKSDTIFNKKINVDSLGQTIIKHKIFVDSTEYSKIAIDYELRKVVFHSVRNNNIYFEADLVSITREKRLKVLFQISYLNKSEIGNLFVNGFNEKGWKITQEN